MPKKEVTPKKTPAKTKKLSTKKKKNIAKRGKEFTDWMVKNINQKWFFSLEEREQIFINKLNELHINYKYISGFKNYKSSVLMECKTCGYRFKITYDRLMRKNVNIICKHCESILKDNIRAEILMQKELENYINKLKREYKSKINNEIKNIFLEIKKNTLHISNCKKCGTEIYINNKNKQICDKCRSKNKNKKHSNKSLKK